MSRAALSLAILLACAAALGADGITVGEEFALCAEGPGKGMEATPAVAFGQGVYLAVWREGWHGKGGSARIHAARVSAEGKLLDGKGIELAPAQAGATGRSQCVQERPRVAFGDGVFLVVWQDFRNGKDYDILAARIGPEGKVLDREPLAVAVGPRNQVLPDVASDGKAFIVVWQGMQGDETGFRGFAAAVSAEGKVGQPVETGMTPQPKVSWNGSQYLAVGGGAGFWAGNVQAVQLEAGGAPRGKPANVIGGTKAAVFSVSGVPGAGWLVVSHRSPPDPWGWGGPGAVRAVLVNTEGRPENQDAVKEPAGVKDRLPGWLDIGGGKAKGGTWPMGTSASAFDGKRSVVVWQRHHLCGEKMTNFENCDLIAARVDGYKSLDLSGVPVAASSAEERQPALASDGAGRLLLVYEKQQGDGCARVMGRMLQTE